MSTNQGILRDWPGWLRAIFAISGCLFVFAAVFLLTLFIARHIDIFSLFYSPLLRYEPWSMTIAEVLPILVIAQAIITTLRHGINWRTIAISVLYGLVALLLIYTFAVFYAVIQLIALTVSPPGLSQQASPGDFLSMIMGGQEPLAGATSNFIVYVTAITGLITAVSGLYGQVISARKMSLEVELARQQLAARQRRAVHKGRERQTAKKR